MPAWSLPYPAHATHALHTRARRCRTSPPTHQPSGPPAQRPRNMPACPSSPPLTMRPAAAHAKPAALEAAPCEPSPQARKAVHCNAHPGTRRHPPSQSRLPGSRPRGNRRPCRRRRQTGNACAARPARRQRPSRKCCRRCRAARRGRRGGGGEMEGNAWGVTRKTEGGGGRGKEHCKALRQQRSCAHRR